MSLAVAVLGLGCVAVVWVGVLGLGADVGVTAPVVGIIAVLGAGAAGVGVKLVLKVVGEGGLLPWRLRGCQWRPGEGGPPGADKGPRTTPTSSRADVRPRAFTASQSSRVKGPAPGW